MLTLKKMEWGNCFSYGEDNYIEFDKEPLTQLIGANGAGKTSISLLIQELLYGKNSKNIKKQDIANNKSGVKGYWANLYFNKDGVDYTVKLDRKSNLKFKLFREDEDISSHTSLNTYKSLAEIIGIDDFKIFCQLIYQHSTDSLEFLTATDTNRKKFLINLLQLEKYIELHDLFKDKAKEANNACLSVEGTIDTLRKWIQKHKDMDLSILEVPEIPEVDKDLYAMKKELQNKIDNITAINRKINNNNTYISQLDRLEPKYYMNAPPSAPTPSARELEKEISVLETKKRTSNTIITKLKKAEGECPSCLQPVDLDLKHKMIKDEKSIHDSLEVQITEKKALLIEVKKLEEEIELYKEQSEEFVRLNQLIDKELPTKSLDMNELKQLLADTNTEIAKQEALVKDAQKQASNASAHNSKVKVVETQLKEFQEEFHEKSVELIEKENLLTVLELLKKSFGTNGLVSYKIESSIKELEKKINEYLAELTHFQLYFKLSGEKLNINIVDDIGNETSVSNLSSGERARVNVATLLAIRSILSSLTATKINFLMLDEVVNTLDEVGREKLAEILLEENLNTFIVSHGWQHPLIPRLEIVKEHHISRIEHG